MQLSAGVNQRSNSLEIPYGYQICYKEPQSKVQCIDGVKDHAGVNQRQNRQGYAWVLHSQPAVKLRGKQRAIA